MRYTYLNSGREKRIFTLRLNLKSNPPETEINIVYIEEILK